ncbi:MAG: hypothetical protein K0R93_501 [Anaerosolibacter sp.]|uniref:S-layer homology domain-containing protein n=1 Tax=Anaerosolibacter sp. TaxID=1872527 RepID=UPI002629848B|nr:S-layer homology domain-containing protein [Anaerosolibacter sp.]MDF2545603.1 hypothetical protein [Anaerosolibacter sp.]
MRKRCIFSLSLVFFFLYFSIVYGTGPGLEMNINLQEMTIHETFNIEITAKDIDGIAGGDILLYYDHEKLKLISKKIELPDEDMVDFQRSITRIGDRLGEVRFVFALKKDKPLLEGAERALGTLSFEAIGTGDVEITLAPASQLVKESVIETGIEYSYINPWLAPPMEIHIESLPQEIPNEDPTPPPVEEPDDESDEEPGDPPNDDVDEEPNDTPPDVPRDEPEDNPSGDPNDDTSDKDGSLPIGSVEDDEGFQDNPGNYGDKNQLDTLDIHSIVQEGLKLCSQIYWLDTPQMILEITIPFEGEDLDTNRLGIYYFHEEKKKWIYLGGEIHGNTLTVGPISKNINFNRLAVLEDRTYPAFTDIAGKDMELDLIKILTLGIMRGYEDITLRLDDVMSREEWTTAWIRALDVPLSEDNMASGSMNVPPWARDYVKTAAELLEDESLMGNGNLSLEEAAAVLESTMKRIHGPVKFTLPEVESDALLTRRQAVSLLAEALRYLKI